MLKKNILILLFSLGVMPALCMDAPLKLTQYQAIDDELVTVELQGGQLFKVQAQHAKLSQALSNLIEDVGTDGILPIPNVTPAIWSKILELKLYLFDVTSEHTNEQVKERNKAIIRDTIQSYDGATLVEFIKSVNFLHIPLLLELAIKVAQTTGLQKITPEQIAQLPREVRNQIILDQMICVLGLVPDKQLSICLGHNAVVRLVCVTHDNKIVSGSHDGTVRVWDMASKQLSVCNGHKGSVISVCVTHDNKIVSGSSDGTVRVWDMAGKQLSVCNGHKGSVFSVCVTHDNKIVSGSIDGTVRVWDMAGKQLSVCKGHTNWFYSVCVMHDNKIVSGSSDGTVRVWDMAGKQLSVCKGHTNLVYSVCVTHDNKIVSGSHDGTVRVWDMAGKQLSVCNGHTGNVTSVCVTHDNKIVSGSIDGTVRVWDMAGNQLGVCDGNTDGVRSVCIMPDNKIVSGSNDCTVRVWDIDWASDISTEQAQQIWRYLQGDGAKDWDHIQEILKPIKSPKRSALWIGAGAAIGLAGVLAYKWFTNNSSNN